MSPELETLDQLLGGDMPLAVVRGLFDSDERFIRSVAAMLHTGEVLLHVDDVEVPHWRWRELLVEACDQAPLIGSRLAITQMGARRIG